MNSIYCIYCGHKNNIKDKRCSKCKKILNPKEHPLKDFLYDMGKDKIKGKANDTILTIISKFIKNHTYGIILSISFIGSLGVGINSLVTNDTSYINKVNEAPTEVVEEISLDSTLFNDVYKFNLSIASSWYNEYVAFYEDKLMKYEDIPNIYRLEIAWDYRNPTTTDISFNTCEDLKEYSEESYNDCMGSGELFYIGSTPLRFFTYSEEEFASTYKEIFNEDIINENFYPRYEIRCQYVDSKNIYFCNETTMAGWNASLERLPIKALRIGEDIIVYDYALYINVDNKAYKKSDLTTSVY